jgi:hypothetical protein
MGERTLTTLRLDGVPVADYVDGGQLDRVLSPRPYLHPVRTLGGNPVTDALPADHRWHLGVSVALQDVDGCNFWGGRTYVRGRGYEWRDDHGRIEHAGFSQLAHDGFTEMLRWLDPGGELLLAEHRTIRAGLAEPGWELEMVTTLTNATQRPVRLGSPATNGRAGAGYGGLFWRLPPAQEPQVYNPAGAGEHAVHGSVAPWLAWADGASGFTLVFTGGDEVSRTDPWFVRVQDYPGVGSQLAARDPRTLQPGGEVTRRLRVLVADGLLDERTVRTWAEGATSER